MPDKVKTAGKPVPDPAPIGVWNQAGAVVSSLNPVPKVQAAADTLAGVGPAITKLGSDASTILVVLAFFTVGMLILLRRQVAPVAKTAITAAVPGGKVAAVAGAIT